MINPTDVAKTVAGFPDLWGAISNQQQMDYERQKDDDERLYRYFKDIDSMHLATGSPYDRLINQNVQGAQGALLNLFKNNRGRRVSTKEMMETTVPYLNAIQKNAPIAKALVTDINNRRSTFDKDYDWMDWNKYQYGAYRNAFYDDKGNIKTELDPQAFGSFHNEVMSDPAKAAQYANLSTLPTHISKTIDQRFPANEQRFPLSGTPGMNAIYDVVDVRPFEVYNTSKRQTELPYTEVEVDGKKAKLLDPHIYEQLASDPAFQVAIQLAKPMYSNFPPLAQNMAAAYEIAEIARGAGNRKKAQMDKSEWLLNRQIERDAQSDYYRARSDARDAERLGMEAARLGISRENLNLSKQRQARLGKGSNQFIDNAMALINKDPKALSNATTYKLKLGDKSADLKVIPGSSGPLLNAVDGSADKVKMYVDNDNDVLRIERYRKKKEGGYEPVPVGQGRWSTIPLKQAPAVLSEYVPQLKANMPDYDPKIGRAHV